MTESDKATPAPPLDSYPTKGWISEGIILATVPILAALISYSYQAGYLCAFDVPVAFATVSLHATIKTFAILALPIFILLVSLSNATHMGLDALFRGRKRKAVLIAGAYTVYGIYAATTLIGVPIWIVASGAIVLVIMTLWARRLKPDAVTELETAGIEVPPVVKKIQRYMQMVSFSCLSLILLLGGAWACGWFYARSQRLFSVIAGPPEAILLAVDDDRLICVSIDSSRHVFFQQFFIRKAGDDPHVLFTLSAVGPLAVSGLPATVQPTSSTKQLAEPVSTTVPVVILPATEPGTRPTSRTSSASTSQPK